MISDELLSKLIDLAVKLQQIPAPTFFEKERAEYLLSQFLLEPELNKIHIDETGNVLARFPGYGNQAPVLLCAHLDTVFPMETDLTIHQKGNRIYGPGIGDNSIAVASLLAVFWLIQERGISLPYDLYFIGTVGEEGLGDLKGIKGITETFENTPQAYIILEGLSYGGICNQGIGVRRFQVAVKTAGGHSWGDFGAPSAIHESAALIQKIIKMPIVDNQSTFNIGTIQGGTSINTIASEARFDVDLRSLDLHKHEEIVQYVQRIFLDGRKPGVDILVEKVGDRPAGLISPDHRLVQAAQEALKAQGENPLIWKGSTDANIPLSKGYPAICIGITRGKHAHTLKEYIFTQYIHRGLEQIIHLLNILAR
ncbi:MAG: M20/M25/M40 family metallo-hydrolase [Anaerolineales bacterium]|nr:M20/M25/M40 family metallo-hydrolase [Anaerolineales bacterium]